MQYRRAFVPGGSFFFTVVTEKRRPLFARQSRVTALGEAIRHVKARRPFSISAIVLLPDHLHTSHPSQKARPLQHLAESGVMGDINQDVPCMTGLRGGTHCGAVDRRLNGKDV